MKEKHKVNSTVKAYNYCTCMSCTLKDKDKLKTNN